MSYYVHRTNPETDREGWVGPIRSENQARKEVDAWLSSGWAAAMFPSSPEVKRAVRDWQKKVQAERAMA